MKNMIYNISLVLSVIIVLTACHKEKETTPSKTVFSIQFSDSTIISEDDILFYDSSTCILFLKEKLSIQYAYGESPNIDFLDFSVLINEQIIYEGIIYPDLVAAVSPSPIFISSTTFREIDADILPINYVSLGAIEPDERNNEQIINALEENDLLRHGLTCSINSIIASSQNDSVLICAFSIKNHDDMDYYILDPQKMGIDHFNYYTGGLNLKHKETNEHYFPKYDKSSVELESVDMDDLSLIKGQDEVTFVIESSYNSVIEVGEYECKLHYGNLRRLYSFDLDLDRIDGRVWVGFANSSIDATIF